jgi:hypothetical protein
MANFAARKWPEFRILHHLSQGFRNKTQPDQGLKLRKYFRGQVGPHQINFGSPHNLLGAHQACIARLPTRLQGALRRYTGDILNSMVTKKKTNPQLSAVFIC